MSVQTPQRVRHRVRHLMNRNAVLLALHVLADDEGIVCRATNRQIATQANRGVDLVSFNLYSLEQEGLVYRLDWRDGSCSGDRYLVLMTHPNAKAEIRHLKRVFAQGSDRRRDRRRKGSK